MRIVTHTLAARGEEPFGVREWREFTASRAFARFNARIDFMIEGKRKMLENAEAPEEWRKAQGAVAALRAVQALAGGMEQEFVDKET